MPESDEVPDYSVRLQKDCDGSERWLILIKDENTGLRISELDCETSFDVILAMSVIGRMIAEGKVGDIKPAFEDLVKLGHARKGE